MFLVFYVQLWTQYQLSFKAPLYSLRVMMALKYVLFLSFITETAKGSKIFLFLSVTRVPYFLILVIKLVINPKSRVNKTVCTQKITHMKISTHGIDFSNKHENLCLKNKDVNGTICLHKIISLQYVIILMFDH